MRERGEMASESDRDGIGTYNFIAKAKCYIDRSNLLRLFIEKIHKKSCEVVPTCRKPGFCFTAS